MGVVERDTLWTVRNEAEELVKLALFYGIKLVTMLALYVDFALDEQTLEEELPAIGAPILLGDTSHILLSQAEYTTIYSGQRDAMGITLF
ncbi:MAG: hypothetical protein AAB879_00095 [Patescibacteria group bacterium]